MDGLGEPVDETVLQEAGQSISLVQANPHHGEALQDLCLYEYMSIVTPYPHENLVGTALGGTDATSNNRSWPRAACRLGVEGSRRIKSSNAGGRYLSVPNRGVAIYISSLLGPLWVPVDVNSAVGDGHLSRNVGMPLSCANHQQSNITRWLRRG